MDPERQGAQDPAADPGLFRDGAIEIFIELGLFGLELPLPLGDRRRLPFELERPLVRSRLPGVELCIPGDVYLIGPDLLAQAAELVELPEDAAALVSRERRVVLRPSGYRARYDRQAQQQSPHIGLVFPPGSEPGQF